jgi:hypothetical protein
VPEKYQEKYAFREIFFPFPMVFKYKSSILINIRRIPKISRKIMVMGTLFFGALLLLKITYSIP